jgi:Sortilin, neurotensin receptor 3,/BNR/Asp-box repeat
VGSGSTNKGTTWEPVFDHEGVASIGDVAIVQSNPDVVWAGTGEPNNRQSSTFGDGIYKSIDAGKTWKHMGLRDTHHIGRIVIDPVDPDIVYVAALGHLWGPNSERGLYKTTDGGTTWANTYFINEDTGFVDVAMHPANRRILYAAAYQRRRAAWGFNGDGSGSGLYKTSDGGKTWKKLTQGLPEGPTGRIGLDVSRSSPNVVYATVENRNGGIFRSDDAGETWQKMSGTNPRPRAIGARRRRRRRWWW